MSTYEEYINYKEEQLMELVNKFSKGIITYEEYMHEFNSFMDYGEFLEFATNQQ